MSTGSKCFFCASECEIYPVPQMHTLKDYRCKYCGQYLFDRYLERYVPGINEKENKFKIACILNERRLEGQSGLVLSNKTDKDRTISNCPMISVSELLDEFPKKSSDFRDRALLNLTRLANPTQPFENIRLDLVNKCDYLHLFTSDKQRSHTFLRMLADDGYIKFNRVPAGQQLDVFSLTNKCREKVETLHTSSRKIKEDSRASQSKTKEETERTMCAMQVRSSKDNWEAIRSEFGISKRELSKKINFVSDEFARKIIFRDVEHAFVLASSGFSKPALILAGGVIEELLRLYLEHNNIKPEQEKFWFYIKACKDNKLLKHGVSPLTDSVRNFRNLVHLAEEKTKKHTVSKATAKGAVASIFTIANDFQ